MLLNISIFMWYGAVCPWASFRTNDVIPLYRLIVLGILILLFRRLPFVFAVHKMIPEIEEFQQAAFVGFFGPIGVSALFYLYVSLEFLNQVTVDGVVREDARHLQDVMRVVIWFLAICSIIVHGLSVPLGKLGYHLPRQLSQAMSTSQENEERYNFPPRHYPHLESSQNLRQRRNPPIERPVGAVFRIGGSTILPKPNIVIDSLNNEPERPISFSVPVTRPRSAIGERGILDGASQAAPSYLRQSAPVDVQQSASGGGGGDGGDGRGDQKRQD
jgi:sodium/hydrogen antiporter